MAGELFASVEGDGGKTIAFLHGFGATHLVWSPIRRSLASGFQTIAFDLPGHGESLGYPDAGPTKIAVGAVVGELETRDLSDVHLVGHSMGGAVAALVALSAPERIASLTLLAPGGFGPEINHRLLARYAAARDAETFRSVLENMIGWNNPVSEETIATLVEMRRRPGQTAMLEKIASGMTRNGLQGTIAREQLARLTMPAKVLWGTQDRVLPTRQAHRLPPMFGGHIFEDTGHMLPEEIPDAVVALVKQNAR